MQHDARRSHPSFGQSRFICEAEVLSSHQQEHLIGNAYNIRIFGTWFAYAMANVVRREQCRPLRQLPICDSSSSDEEDAENL